MSCLAIRWIIRVEPKSGLLQMVVATRYVTIPLNVLYVFWRCIRRPRHPNTRSSRFQPNRAPLFFQQWWGWCRKGNRGMADGIFRFRSSPTELRRISSSRSKPEARALYRRFLHCCHLLLASISLILTSLSTDKGGETIFCSLPK